MAVKSLNHNALTTKCGIPTAMLSVHLSVTLSYCVNQCYVTLTWKCVLKEICFSMLRKQSAKVD